MTTLVQNRLPSVPKFSTNAVQAALLIVALTAGLVLTAWSVAGLSGLTVMLLSVAAILVFEPKIPGLSLMDLYRAEKQGADQNQVSSLVDVLAYRAGLTKRPDLYVIPSLTLSAFSMSHTNGPAIAVTEGLLRRLTLRETGGILAHEMIHIRNGDTGVFKLADALSRLTPVMAVIGVVLTLANLVAATGGDQLAPWTAIAALYCAPALSSALQLWLSHSREDDVDRQAAALTGDAMGLASALQRMQASTGSFWDDFRLPLPGRRVPFPSLLRSHALDKVRIARLLNPQAAIPPGFDPIIIVEQPMVSLVGYGPGEMRTRTRWTGLWF